MAAQDQQSRWQQRWQIVLAAGVIIGAAMGIRHVQGLFLQPVTASRGWSRETFGFALAIQNLVWGFVQPFAGMIADRFGSVRVIVAGAIAYALGLYTMSHATTVELFVFGNGFLVGTGLAGTAFGVVYGPLNRLFPVEQRSAVLGVAGAIGGLCMFLMVPSAQGLISSVGWTSAVVALAVLMVMTAPLSGYLREERVSTASAEAHLTLRQAIREAFNHRGFWLLNAGFFACGFQLAFIAGHMPAYLVDKGAGVKVASTALALIALANTFGTYICGYLGGFLRRKYVLSVIYLTRAVAMALFFLLPLSPITVYGFSIVMGLIWLGTVPLTNGLLSQVFGVRYITTLFGFVFVGHQLGSFFGTWLGGYVFDVTRSYDLMWIISVVIALIAALLHWPINDKQIERIHAVGPVGQSA